MKNNYSTLLLIALLVTVPLVIFSAMSRQDERQLAQSNGTANPSFGVFAPCPSCASDTVAPMSGGATAPSAAVAPQSASQAPCDNSDITDNARHHKSKHKKHSGSISNSMQDLLKLLLDLINKIIQLLGGSPISIPQSGNDQPSTGSDVPNVSTPPDQTGQQNPCQQTNGGGSQSGTGSGSGSSPAQDISSAVPSGAAAAVPSGSTSADACAPSGEKMPTGDLPGWKQIFSDDFSQNVAVGGWPGPYAGKWSGYSDGTPDTAGKNNGKPSEYYPSKVLSVSNCVLDMFLHSEGGKSMGAAPEPNGAKGQLYGKYTVRFKTDSIKGFKTAWLLWPDSGSWPKDGEIDFPEGDLSSTIGGFMHRQDGTSGSDQDAIDSGGVSYSSGWHTADLEWGPNNLKATLDGKVLKTITSRVPNTSMHYVMQTESCLTSCPDANASAHLQVDWFVMYAKQ